MIITAVEQVQCTKRASDAKTTVNMLTVTALTVNGESKLAVSFRDKLATIGKSCVDNRLAATSSHRNVVP